MKNFLKFIWSGLFSNQAVLDNKNRNLYQAFIVLLISLVVAVLPVLGATLGTNGSDILTNSKNGSLDVSLNLFSKYLSEDENANFYTTNDGKYVVTGFKEKVITDSTGKHLLTVYAADNGEVLTDIVTKYTNGYVDETTKISETPRSLMLISDDVLYIYVFAGDAKNEIKDGFNFIEQQLCMHCGLCHKTCSYDAIDKIDGNFVVNDEKCTYCGACKNACPARAFLFERNFKDSIEGI